MKLCLITYDVPHLKTAQVAIGLKNRGFDRIDFLLMPFRSRTKRHVLFEHRPAQTVGPEPRSLAGYTSGQIYPYDFWSKLVAEYDFFIVCGSNIIGEEFARCGKILNVHAGLIPAVRGLDSFKWAILKRLPLGNTLHRIDAQVDAGEVLALCPTPVFAEDDLQTLARRHYENEIWMLTNIDNLLVKPHPTSLLPVGEPTMRMSSENEARMMSGFEDYKKEFSVASVSLTI